MIRVQNLAIINDDYLAYFNEMMKRDMPAKQCLELSECIDKIQGQFEVLKRAQIAITKKYCAVDKKSEMKTDEKGAVIFDDINKKLKCNEELAEIFKQSIELPLTSKVKIKETETFTPYKINLLKDIVEIVPDETAPNTIEPEQPSSKK